MIDLALAGKHSASLIEEKIEVFRSFVAANSQKVSQNPAGFLIRSLKNTSLRQKISRLRPNERPRKKPSKSGKINAQSSGLVICANLRYRR